MGLFNNKKPAALVDGTEILESYDRGELRTRLLRARLHLSWML